MMLFELGGQMPEDYACIPPFGNGGSLLLSKDTLAFFVGLSNMSGLEAKMLNEAPIEIGVLHYMDLMALPTRIDELTFDFHYNFDVGKYEMRGLPPHDGSNMGYGVSLVGYDTASNIIKANRFFTLSPTLSSEMYVIVELLRQKYHTSGLDPERSLHHLYAQYSDVDSMFRDCIIKETAGKPFNEE